MNTLTWLHISDLHLGEENTDWTALRTALLCDIEEHQDPTKATSAPCAGRVLKPDLIFITGDLASKGKENDYQSVSNFLKQLWQATSLDKSRTFIIPGNHDVDRDIVEKDALYQNMRSTLASHDLDQAQLEGELRRFWPQREWFFKKHNAFKTAAAELGAVQPHATYFLHRLDLADLPPIEIVGVNSAWMSDRRREDTARELIIGLPQVDDIREQLSDRSQVVRIALLHHPFEAIHPYDRSVDDLTKLCAFILFGHLHTQRPRYVDEPGHEHVMIPAGAIYLGDRFAAHAYNFAQLDLDKGDVTVFLRRATVETTPRYIRDNETYPEGAPQGECTWHLKRLAPTVEETGTSSLEPQFSFRRAFAFVKLVRWRDRETGEEPFEQKNIHALGKEYSIPVYDEAICYALRTYERQPRRSFSISLKSSGFISLLYPKGLMIDESDYWRSQGGLLNCEFPAQGKDHIAYIWRIYNGFQRGEEDFGLSTHGFKTDESLLTIDFSSLKEQAVFRSLPIAHVWTPGECVPGRKHRINATDEGWIWSTRKVGLRQGKLSIRWQLSAKGGTSQAWVFGYGSLMSPASIAQTLAGRHIVSKDLTPCVLRDYKRVWSAYRQNIGRLAIDIDEAPEYIAYLNIEPKPSAHTNGVVFPVNEHDLQCLSQREAIYVCVDVTDQINVQLPLGSRVFTYISVSSMPRKAYKSKTVVSRDYWELVQTACKEMGQDFVSEYKKTTELVPYPIATLSATVYQ